MNITCSILGQSVSGRVNGCLQVIIIAGFRVYRVSSLPAPYGDSEAK